MRVLKAVEEVNEQQKSVLFRKLNQYYAGDLKGKTIAVWGLAFKAETDDMREATSLVTIQHLLETGCHVRVYDPIAMKECRRRMGDRDVYKRQLLSNQTWRFYILNSWSTWKLHSFNASSNAMALSVTTML